MTRAIGLAVLLLVGCGGASDVDSSPPSSEVQDTRTEAVCSPERPGGRTGCKDEDGACLTYDCCRIDGCGPDHDDCDCCGFDDAPLDEC